MTTGPYLTAKETATQYLISTHVLNQWRKRGLIEGIPTRPATETRPAQNYIYSQASINARWETIRDQGKRRP